MLAFCSCSKRACSSRGRRGGAGPDGKDERGVRVVVKGRWRGGRARGRRGRMRVRRGVDMAVVMVETMGVVWCGVVGL